MTKQKEIKKGIKNILKERYGENWIHGKVALQIVHTLHSQGCVLKVKRDLPKYKNSWESDGKGLKDVIVPITIEDLLKAGYVATEPLIEEVKDET